MKMPNGGMLRMLDSTDQSKIDETQVNDHSVEIINQRRKNSMTFGDKTMQETSNWSIKVIDNWLNTED